MTRPPTDREALIAALAEEARAGAAAEAGGTPEPEEMLDFLAGRLDPEEEERISRQVAASPEASRALLDLADFEAAGDAAGARPPEVAAAAGWRDFERRLPSAPARPRRLWTLLPSIAAGLLVAVLGFRVWQLESERSRPIANLQSLELVASRAGAEPSIALEPGEPLRLVIAPAASCPVYSADVEGPGSGDRQTIDGLVPDARGNLSLLLTGGPGTYNLRLSGCEPRRESGSYRFEVTPE